MLTLDVHAITGAVSQYTGYDFNSMVKFGDQYLGANGSGLFSLGGDTDDGQDIDAFFELATTDLGRGNNKRIRRVYLGYESDGDLEFSILFDEKTQTEDTVTVDSLKEGQQTRQKTTRRDNFGSWMRFKLSNVDGSDFSIDSIDALVVTLTPRRSR